MSFKYKKIVILNFRSKKICWLPMYELFLAEAMKTQGVAEEIKIYTLLNTEEPEKYLKEWQDADLILIWEQMGTRAYSFVKSYVNLVNFLKKSLSTPVYFGGYWATSYIKDFWVNGKEGFNGFAENDRILQGFSIDALVKVLQEGKDRTSKERYIDISGDSNFDKYPLNLSYLATPHVYFEKNRNKRLHGYLSSFSCPRNCIFCEANVFRNWEANFSARDMETVKKDIDALIEYFDFNEIFVKDLNWFYEKDRFFEFSDYLKSRGKKTCINVDIVLNDVTEDIVRQLKEDNVASELYFGLESFNPEFRKKVGKPFTQEKLEAAFDLMEKYEINLNGNLILGLPWQTREDIEYEIKMALLYIERYKHVFITLNSLFPEYDSTMQKKFFPDLHEKLSFGELVDVFSKHAEGHKNILYGEKFDFINTDRLFNAFKLIGHATRFSGKPPYVRGKILFAFRNLLIRQASPPYFSNPIVNLMLGNKTAKFIGDLILPPLKVRFRDITLGLIWAFFNRLFTWGRTIWYTVVGNQTRATNEIAG